MGERLYKVEEKSRRVEGVHGVGENGGVVIPRVGSFRKRDPDAPDARLRAQFRQMIRSHPGGKKGIVRAGKDIDYRFQKIATRQ